MNAVVNAISSTIDALNDFSIWLYELVMYQIGFFMAYSDNYLLKQKNNLIDVYDFIVSFWMNYTDYLYQFMKIPDVINAYNALYASELGFFLDYFKVSLLVSSFITASLIRFAIRRLPVIG